MYGGRGPVTASRQGTGRGQRSRHVQQLRFSLATGRLVPSRGSHRVRVPVDASTYRQQSAVPDEAPDLGRR